MGELQRLIAGSWVYGNSLDLDQAIRARTVRGKCCAKRSVPSIAWSWKAPFPKREQNAAERQLGVCEGLRLVLVVRRRESSGIGARTSTILYRRHLANLVPDPAGGSARGTR